MIGCALIGKGYWGSILKRYIEENRNFSLLYVCDSKANLRKVFADPYVKAVVVATPIETHYAIVKAALQCGKHVLSEKPLALKADECLELKELAEKKGRVLLVDYVFMFSKALEKAREIIDGGRLGRLLSVEMSVRHLGRFGKESVFWLLASHMLSVLDLFVPLCNLEYCFVNLVDGETGSIFFDGQVKGRIDVSINYPWKETEIVLYCQHGTLKYNPAERSTLSVVRYKKPVWTVASKIPKHTQHFPFDESHNLRFAFELFARLIFEGGVSNARLAVEVTKIIEEGLRE